METLHVWYKVISATEVTLSSGHGD